MIILGTALIVVLALCACVFRIAKVGGSAKIGGIVKVEWGRK